MPLLSFGLTDVGQTRQTNQDAIYLSKKDRVFIIADGMGGHNGGDIASNLAIHSIPQYITKHFNSSSAKKILHDSIQYANDVIQTESTLNPKLSGMGTTVSACMFHDNNLYIGNVGDSRVYLINKKKIYALTSDHSLIQEKINLGILSRQEALLDPQKNVLIRAVGFEKKVHIDIYNYTVLKHDIFLICSDGLHGKVSEKDMLHIINQCIPSPDTAQIAQLKQAVQALIGLANLNGGQDNISVILIVAL